MFKKIIVCCGLSILFGPAVGQVAPHINSGNPAFPFPQFLDYGTDRKTLASVNAPGVTHAEMEQRTREAWQLVCNNTSPYPNTVVSGVQYLYPTAPNSCTCVEGDGYYLLGAALMGDKTFFDGYYMWAHDRGFQGVKRFIDGQLNSPNYLYNKGLSGAASFGAGTGVLGGGISGNSATDGDEDVALALLIAYKQWGENSGIALTAGDWGGATINYKEEALRYIKAMADTVVFAPALPTKKYVTGVIGLDGYVKGGDSYGELTSWATAGYKGMQTQWGSQSNHFIDYNAPAWYRAFNTFLEEKNPHPFLLSQFKRAEASSDWLMGLHYSKNPKNIPYMGKVTSLAGNDFNFDNYIPDGEDFRAPWRTVMNYVWHGNPTFTWNPVTHEVENTPNTYERDMGLRYAAFLKNNQGAPWSNPCTNIGALQPKLTFKGPSTLVNGYTPQGEVLGAFPWSWIHGTGAASAIAGQDLELMGEMFRQCVIAWDAATGQNLDSRPLYFHEWFRLLGMLTLAGNFHTPANMVAKPNLKVYHKVNRTSASIGDLVTYTVSYRNYGSVDGAGTVVKFGIPKGYEFVSSNKGIRVSDSVVWNVGMAKGFQSGGLAATLDSMKVTLKVGETASGRQCTKASISCTNGFGWTSNEYPNNITTIMERNCVDIIQKGLRIEKTASVQTINPSVNKAVTYKLKFGNTGDTTLLNGGRPGVRLAFAIENSLSNASAATAVKVRIFHDAAEPYIDYGNYRVSYFINDPTYTCYTGTSGCLSGWTMLNTIAEGIDPKKVRVTHENILPGQNVAGKWNQRIILQFSPQLATTTQHLEQYAGAPRFVHEGGFAPLRGVWRLFSSDYRNVDWTDDWSWNSSSYDEDGGIYYPIGDDYTIPSTNGLPINSWHKSGCQTTSEVVKKVLGEEWDGYTWRRIYGNAPSLNTPSTNVVLRDTLPAGVSVVNFVKKSAYGVQALLDTLADGRNVVSWKMPLLGATKLDSIIYTANLTATCPTPDKEIKSKAWISSDGTGPLSATTTVVSTCMTTLLPYEVNSQQAITLYPNPAKDEVTLHMGIDMKEMAVSVKDVKGHVVYLYKGESKKVLDISGLASGVYLVEISADASVYRSKLVVVK